MPTFKIAIDGPAGAGKSTMAKIIAKQLGYVYIDTGAMYRAVALRAIKSNVDISDIDKVCEMLENLSIVIKYDKNGQVILLNGENVTNAIRSNEVSIGASNVAVIPEVRKKLVHIQQELASKNNVVMDGRDIGTHVLPDANIKIFLTASVDDRAQRRYNEMIAKGYNCSFDEIKRDIEYRDKNDSSRAVSPLKVADDAIVVDTSGNTLEQSIRLILNIIKKKGVN